MIKWFSAFILSILVHALIFLIYSFLDSVQEETTDRKITNVSFVQPEKKDIDIKKTTEKKDTNTKKSTTPESIKEPEKKTIKDLDKYLIEEQDQETFNKKLDKVEQISAQVIKDIESIWIRPNNITKGMYAEFNLTIDRLGNIDNFDIKRSSGSDTFDRAAINAIKKYKKIKYIKNVDEETYRIYFANFTLRFKPE
jgi:TonB family protein|tara:strand:+ start:925 stop:1512 length:588 start_codon:yes stop_codon:yes gene_type:complete